MKEEGFFTNETKTADIKQITSTLEKILPKFTEEGSNQTVYTSSEFIALTEMFERTQINTREFDSFRLDWNSAKRMLLAIKKEKENKKSSSYVQIGKRILSNPYMIIGGVFLVGVGVVGAFAWRVSGGTKSKDIPVLKDSPRPSGRGGSGTAWRRKEKSGWFGDNKPAWGPDDFKVQNSSSLIAGSDVIVKVAMPGFNTICSLFSLICNGYTLYSNRRLSQELNTLKKQLNDELPDKLKIIYSKLEDTIRTQNSISKDNFSSSTNGAT